MRPDQTVHTAPLISPAGERWRHRRQRRRSAAALRKADHETRRADARARADAERAQRHATTYLPPGGEPGPAGLRSYRRFRLPAHRDTSAALAGAYPFLAEAGLGADGVFVGQDLYSGA